MLIRLITVITSLNLVANVLASYLDYLATLRLPDEHWQYFFNNNPDLRKFCLEDSKCPYQEYANKTRCWGYEAKCPKTDRMLNPQCPDTKIHQGWFKDGKTQLQIFWEQADFGYVKERRNELKTFCKPHKPGGASLECSGFTRFCRAKNIYLDFRTANLMKGERNRYREDVFQPGELGGHCQLFKKKLDAEGEHKSPLQSWFGELQHYVELDFDPFEDTERHCDIVFDKPTFLMKLDAGVNMFHHYCDYINLYLSMHVNNSFSMDNHIIMWDTSPMSYGDFFHDSWKAFTYFENYIHLNTFDGKKVCIKDAVFPLLPRMRYGHYYNMPLIPGCRDTGVYRSFSQLVLHRLNITQEGPLENKIRITILSRKSKHRRILNEEELTRALKTVSEYDVRVENYDGRGGKSYLEQLQSTANSDIFIGMHGAGLTHALFLPDWGSLFELYNCEDKDCYKDLARLRGVNYQTWEKEKLVYPEDEGIHPTLKTPHKKFTNYEFDVPEFMRLVEKCAASVKSHTSYKQAMKTKYIKDEL